MMRIRPFALGILLIGALACSPVNESPTQDSEDSEPTRIQVFDNPEDAMAANAAGLGDLDGDKRYVLRINENNEPELIERDPNDTWERHAEFPKYADYGTEYGTDELPWIFVEPGPQLSFNEMEVRNNLPVGELVSLLKLRSIEDLDGPQFTLKRAMADLEFITPSVEQISPYESIVTLEVDELAAYEYTLRGQQTLERWNGQFNPQRLLFQGQLVFETTSDKTPLIQVPYRGVFAIYES